MENIYKNGMFSGIQKKNNMDNSKTDSFEPQKKNVKKQPLPTKDFSFSENGIIPNLKSDNTKIDKKYTKSSNFVYTKDKNIKYDYWTTQ